MSADNGYSVRPLYRLPGKFGIFYYSGDSDNPAQYYRKDNAIGKVEYDLATQAIIDAHAIDHSEKTEYGVYVISEVLARAEEEINTAIKTYIEAKI